MLVPLLGQAIRHRHSAVDEERGGRVIARHSPQDVKSVRALLQKQLITCITSTISSVTILE